MRVEREFYKNPKMLPHEEFVTPGSPLCAGCGGLSTLRQVHKILGENVVIVNAAGCMTLMAVYPYTPLRSSWLYTTMGGASAGAQGIRDALDILKKKGRLEDADDLQVVVLAGDGSTYDMGLSSTSGALYRDLDFWYLCYDNEAYGNTGFQTSSSSPYGSHTATSHSAHQQKKDLFEIWRAQHPPYLATISAHDAVDLAEKVHRGLDLEGPKMLIALSACPTGWGFAPALSDEVSELAISTGVWPLKESVRGNLRHTYVPNKLKPVEEYLKPQRRFRHLFEPERDDAALAVIQDRVDRYWEEVRERELQPSPG